MRWSSSATSATSGHFWVLFTCRWTSRLSCAVSAPSTSAPQHTHHTGVQHKCKSLRNYSVQTVGSHVCVFGQACRSESGCDPNFCGRHRTIPYLPDQLGLSQSQAYHGHKTPGGPATACTTMLRELRMPSEPAVGTLIWTFPLS